MLTNRSGDDVDPVPFLVVSLSGALLALSFGPLYLNATLGLTIRNGVLVSAGVSVAVAAAAWYRLVWTHDPEYWRTVPASARLRRLYYGMLAFGVVLLALMLPFW